MNNENIERIDARSVRKLDALTEEQRNYVIEIASQSRLIDVVDVLKEFGIVADVSTVSRYLKRHREKELLDDGAAMEGAVNALAERGESGTLRKGTLEAVRQRLYDRVLTSDDPAEALAMYNSMLKEESKLKELEIEARKVAVAEEQVRLQRAKLKENGERKKVMVESSVVEDGVGVNGEGGSERGVSEREGRLLELMREVAGILNRGGGSDEKVVEARLRLGQEVKLLGSGGDGNGSN